jgi:Domain of unknown function (DUF6089)
MFFDRMYVSRKARPLLLAGLFVGLGAQAQQIEIGLGGGGMAYKGDISPALNPRFARPAVSGFLRYNATKSVSFRGAGAFGSFGAEDRLSSDPFQRARNYSFTTTLIEASLDIEYNFLNYRMDRTVKNWSPYVFGGVAGILFKPTGNIGPVRSFLPFVNFPLGVGVKYELARPWSIAAEFGTRFTGTDFLDNLAARDVRTGQLTQGDPSHDDNYSYLSVTVSYTFYHLVCPPGTRVR